MTFHPTLASRFELLQTDPGDPLFCNYVLEHQVRLLTAPAYPGTLWSPPFFYPEKNVLAYSENFMGELPLYGLFRLAAPPLRSYQLLVILLPLLCFAAMLVLLRRLEVRPLLAALGAFWFAFSMPRAAQIGHLQLLPAFYAPLVLLALLAMLASPRRDRLLLLLALLYLQLLASIHLGWLLLFSLLFLVPLLLLFDPSGRQRLMLFCRRHPVSLALSLLAWAAATLLTFRPYLQAGAQLGLRDWHTVELFLPRWKSWLSVPPGSWYAGRLHFFPPGTPVVWEHYLFAGLVFTALTLFAAWRLLRRRAEARQQPPLALACWGTALAMVALSLYLPRFALEGGRLVKLGPGWSLWWGVYQLVPGAAAIRAVGRISIVVYLTLALAVCCGVEAAARRSRLRRPAQAAVLLLLLAAAVVEQVQTHLPAFPGSRFTSDVAALRAVIPRGCKAAYVSLCPAKGFLLTQLEAMWVGLEAGVPVVNGYSGNFPPGYPNPTVDATPETLRKWSGEDPCIVPGCAAAAGSPHRAAGIQCQGIEWQSRGVRHSRLFR
ncbi:MAG TPA: hypothetical protein VE075_04770 [Thermoanaerobaculia bacterium]|nr:hypothetical protein [Thermoanaerobaculia bacterium]